MASTPRLHDLDPQHVSDEVTRLVLEHLHSLACHVGAEVHQTAPTSVGYSAALLTRWAQHGTNPERWDDGMAWDAVRAICECLYSQAGVPGTFGDGPFARSKHEPADALEVVLLAAWCRVLIAQGAEVPVRALAALSGLRVQVVRNLASAGELAVHDGLVSPEEARRWLGGRGIAV